MSRSKLTLPKITLKGVKKSGIFEDASNVPVEDHFILRLPSNLSQSIKDSIKKRDPDPSFSITFQDQRHAIITSESINHHAIMYDLPCIIESQKTLDSKQVCLYMFYYEFYKIADISQILVVDENDSELNQSFQYPHGISAPLKHVRKYRFRDRISKKAIEDVEKEVERLLQEDAMAQQVEYTLYDQREFEESYLDINEEDDDQTNPDNDDFDDFDLAAEIEEALDTFDDTELDPNIDPEEVDDSTEDEDAYDIEDEEEEESMEKKASKQQIQIINDEITDLNEKIQQKKDVLENQNNPIMRKRIEEVLRNLSSQLLFKQNEVADIQKSLLTKNTT